MKAQNTPAWVAEFKPRGHSGVKCGCNPKCKECVEYGKLASLFRYYTNRERRLKVSRDYYFANKDRHSARMRGWYLRNSDRVNRKTNAYAKAHREAHRAAYRKSYWKNREKYVAISVARRSGHKISEMDMRDVIRINRNRYGRLSCYLCGVAFDGERFAFEHILPIKMGGLTHVGNLDLAHKSCNSSKHAMTLIAFKRKVRLDA